jgi:hypothetical protein
MSVALAVFVFVMFVAGMLIGYSWGHTDGWIERAHVAETPDDDPRGRA